VVTGDTLERTHRPDSTAWISVPGAEAYRVTLDLTETQAFFRLRH